MQFFFIILKHNQNYKSLRLNLQESSILLRDLKEENGIRIKKPFHLSHYFKIKMKKNFNPFKRL